MSSVGANIVEGQTRGSKREFKRFLRIANGSLAEVEYHLELARDLSYLSATAYDALEKQRSEVGFLISRFLESL